MDLGSGGGFDCLIAAKEVGHEGQVIGVDMTPDMLAKARANAKEAGLGAERLSFRLGEIEHLPCGDSLVDCVVSNCVINLSPDKPQVFREAFRVLRPVDILSNTFFQIGTRCIARLRSGSSFPLSAPRF